MRRLLVVLAFLVAVTARAQHTVTFRGDMVNWVRIEEDNSYCDGMHGHEMVYPPAAWIEYMVWDGNKQMLLERKARRTKTTEMDSTAWLHLDSLMAEMGVTRLATAADLGITEEMLRRTVTSREARRRFGRVWVDYFCDSVSLEGFDRWLTEKYENQVSNPRSVTIMTDVFGFIRIEISLNNNKKAYFGMWRYHPEAPCWLDGMDFFNLHVYRHLCALMPKTFDFSYENLLRNIILAYLSEMEY